MQNSRFDVMIGSENRDGLAGGAEDFVNEMRNGRFAGRASDANDLEIASGMAIVSRKQLDFSTFKVEAPTFL